MIKSLITLVYGIAVAVLVIAVALLASVWIIGLAAKAALFGEPRISLAMKVFQRISKAQKMDPTDITHITPNNGGEK